MQDLTVFIANHQALVMAFAVLLGLLTVVEFLRQRRANAGLTPAAAVLLMNRERAVVVDIRDADTYKSGHIIDALSLPKASVEAAAKTLEKNRAKPIIIACYSGTTAATMADGLKQKGFRTHVLLGGMRAWAAAELPLVKKG